MSSLNKLKSLDRLLSALQKERKKSKKIVFTNGCFDILHVGHVRYLKKARALGDRLVVALNTDASVKKLKGPTRPLTSQKDRAEVLSALECVDYLIFFNDSTPERLIRAIRPDFLVKGGDWKKEAIVGWKFVESYGGKVKSLPFVKGFSTTGLIQKIQTL
jgi:D-beta-D-heptose 7-phosphate kinase/D-beta-D-heptose 1-phosphate adenosyltransferase